MSAANVREFSLLIERTKFRLGDDMQTVLERRILGEIPEAHAREMARHALRENASHRRVRLEAREVPVEWVEIEEFNDDNE